jgi:alpha-amylase/alpha-mannosidase (GH57 family)
LPFARARIGAQSALEIRNFELEKSETQATNRVLMFFFSCFSKKSGEKFCRLNKNYYLCTRK